MRSAVLVDKFRSSEEKAPLIFVRRCWSRSTCRRRCCVERPIVCLFGFRYCVQHPSMKKHQTKMKTVKESSPSDSTEGDTGGWEHTEWAKWVRNWTTHLQESLSSMGTTRSAMTYWIEGKIVMWLEPSSNFSLPLTLLPQGGCLLVGLRPIRKDSGGRPQAQKYRNKMIIFMHPTGDQRWSSGETSIASRSKVRPLSQFSMKEDRERNKKTSLPK